MENQLTDLQRAARVAATVQIQAVDLETLVAECELPRDGSIPESIRYNPSMHGSEHEITDEHLFVTVSLRFEALNQADDSKVLGIGASFRVRYSISGEHGHSPEDLDCFARLNGTFNVWPYWRELTQTFGSRAGLSGFMIPVFRPHEWQRVPNSAS